MTDIIYRTFFAACFALFNTLACAQNEPLKPAQVFADDLT